MTHCRFGFFFLIGIAAVTGQDLQWSPTGSLITPRSGACLVALQDGRVLAAGGDAADGPLRSTEIYTDPLFAPAADMQTTRSAGLTCTLLQDGRVLAVGGRSGSGSAEIFDPATGVWTLTSNAPFARWGHTATALPDGSVLLAGGETADGPVNLLERYDPIADQFTILTSTLTSPRKLHAAVLLPSGLVMIAGGSDGSSDLASIDIADAWNDTVQPGPAMLEGRSALRIETSLNGQVFLVGGRSSGVDLATTLVYDPASGTLTAGPTLAIARSAHQLLRIPNNGGILVIGGVSGAMATASTELFDPVNGQFIAFGNLTLAREGLVAAAIGDSGAVLAAGGSANGVPVAACGKTSATRTLTADKAIYLVGQRAVLTGNWGSLKEIVNVTIQLTPVSGAAVVQALATLVSSDGTISVTSNNLIGPATALVTATGATSGATVMTTFQVNLASTLSFLAPSPLSPAPIRSSVTMTVRLHPTSINGASMAGSFSLKDGSVTLATVSTVDTARFHVDAAGDGIAVFALTGGFSTAGAHSLSATFQPTTASLVAGSTTPNPLPYSVNRRTPRLSATMQNLPVRILDTANVLAVIPPESGVSLATGFVSLISGTTTLARTGLVLPSGFTLAPASSASLQYATGTQTGRKTFELHYEGNDQYEPISVTVVVDQKGVIPDLTVSITPTPPATALAPGVEAQVNVVFRPRVGLDPMASSVCAPPSCGWSYRVDQKLVQKTVTIAPSFGTNIPNNLTPSNTNGTPIRLTLDPIMISETGAASMTVTFSGPDNFDFVGFYPNYGNVTLAPIQFTIANKGTPSLILTAEQATTFPNRTVRIHASARGGAIAPSGTFQILEGSTLLSSQTTPLTLVGSNEFEIIVPATAGTHTYTLAYSGDANFNPRTTTVTLTVN